MPVVVLSQVFPARPSSIPDIRDFVRRCLAESPLTDEGNREVGETVFRALLDAAGPTGSIQVAFRIFPEHVEVDVLHSDSQIPAAAATDPPSPRRPRPRRCTRGPGTRPHRPPAAPVAPGGHSLRPSRCARPAGPARHVRGVDVHRAAPGGPDPGGGGPPARRVGEDRQPLGRRRDRATDAGPAADPGSLRRGSAPLARSARWLGLFTARGTLVTGPNVIRPSLSCRTTGRPPTCVLRCSHGGSRWTPPARHGSWPDCPAHVPGRAGRQAGHDLTIEVGRWSGELTINDDLTPAALDGADRHELADRAGGHAAGSSRSPTGTAARSR